jgi:CRISPR system Cascade subunit CasB
LIETNTRDLIFRHVQQQIGKLCQRENESFVRAALANLRRGIGKAPGSIPSVWEWTLSDLPDQVLSQSGEPTYGEWAIHTAMTLYAFHQQGKDIRTANMNTSKSLLGQGIRKLALARMKGQGEQEEDQGVVRRFQAIVTSNSMSELSSHLKGIVQLLKAADIPLDYSRLAVDLYEFQYPQNRNKVRLRWGQEYYATNNMRKEEENESK